ncbi:MAG: nitroreductase [Gammaproteobacteria bacterium]|jgi:nitroreductase|nr:nitroreductase [Gammaproteobacteria bacterium]MDH3756683.1 nitroreductase [Gammaproteobacteria bacterium]MDH3846290.1 nitroreductase [Gammaproteobacteria bacterium]MDH3864416.1 nitroreductase [Gammaproteobacteria bacterium]MDH3904883.1 nitroreductase [Gammaproteobacteria bacterium]
MSNEAPPSYETQSLRDFAEVIRGRRTINLYLQTPVPRELVREAIEAATWAPNHHVTEPWHFYLLGSETIERCLDLCYEIVTAKKAPDAGKFKREQWSEKPGWLVVTCRRSDDDLLQREDYAACAAALQNLMLYLWKAGIGSKWTTGDITRDSRFFDIVGIDESEEVVVGMLWYGYPKITPAQKRKGLDEVLSELP